MIALTAEELYKNVSDERKKKIKFSESFGTLNEFVEATERPSEMSSMERSSIEAAPSEDWDLNTSLKKARELVRGGWKEGTEKITSKSMDFINEFAKKIEQPAWNYHLEAAGNLDVAKYLEDEPECWIRLEQVEVTRPAVTIVLNITASCFVDANTMAARGLQAANLAQALDAAGFKTRVILTEVITSYGETTAETYITVKDFGELLDIDALVFSMIHPAMFRRLGFAYMETWDSSLRREFNVGHGYGRSLLEAAYQGDIYFGLLNGHQTFASSPAETEKYIKGKLKEFGVEIKEEYRES